MDATVTHGFDIVVVGVDGTERSDRALAWAAAEMTVEMTGEMAGEVAGGGVVHLVHAISPTVELAVAAVQADSRRLVRRRRALLAGAWSEPVRAVVTDRGVAVEHHVIEDTPAAAILRVAEQVGAGAIVVGAHARELHGPATIGATIGHLVEFATVPVVIVGSDAGRSSDATPVVVAVGADSQHAVRWAVHYAAARGRGISLVRVGRDPIFSLDGLLDILAYHLDPTALRRWRIEDLEAAAADVQLATDDELAISWSSPRRSSGRRLVEAGSVAAIVVVGRPARRRASAGSVPGWLRRVITHASCPVVVVPDPATPPHHG